MGNKPSIKLFQLPELVLLEWDKIITYDNRRILKNFVTKEEMEEFEMVIQQPQQLNLEKRIFQLRYNSPILVAAHYFEEAKQNELCSSYYKGNIYLENILLRLNQIDQIPFPDIVYLYQQVLFGFQELFEFYGPFYPSQEFICINYKAEVKIWCHALIQRNMPEQIPSRNNITESSMVFRIIKMVEKIVNTKGAPVNFSQLLLEESQQLTFKTTTTKFLEILKSNRITTPKYLNSVKKLLDRVGRADPFEVIKMRQSFKRQENKSVIESKKQAAELPKQPVKQAINPPKINKVLLNLKQKKQQVVKRLIQQQSVNVQKNNYYKRVSVVYQQPLCRNSSLSSLQAPYLTSLTKVAAVQQNMQNLIKEEAKYFQKLDHFHSHSKEIMPSSSIISQHNSYQQIHHGTKLSKNRSESQLAIKTNFKQPIHILSSSQIQDLEKQRVYFAHMRNSHSREQSRIFKIVPDMKAPSALQVQFETAYNLSSKNQSVVLPTATSFEMSATKSRFITSPSLGNTSCSVQENNNLWSPTNSLKVKNKPLEVGIKVTTDPNNFRNINKYNARLSSPGDYQKVEIGYVPKQTLFQTNRNLSSSALQYIKLQQQQKLTNFPHQQTHKERLKTLSQCTSQVSKPNSSDTVKQAYNTNLQLPVVQFQQQLITQMRSTSFKKQKNLNSFSLDDLDNFFDQKKQRTLSKQQIEQFQNQLSQQISSNFKRKDIGIQDNKQQALFEEKQPGSLFFASTTYKRPKSTKGKVAQIHHKITPRVLRYDNIPEVNLSQEEKSYITIRSKDLTRDLMELRENSIRSLSHQSDPMGSLYTYVQQ